MNPRTLASVFYLLFLVAASYGFEPNADVKSYAFSELNGGKIALYDAANELKIIDAANLRPSAQRTLAADEITSLAFDAGELYAGLSSGIIVKFSKDLNSREIALDVSSLGLDTRITHLSVTGGKIYAVAGENIFLVYDPSAKKLSAARLSGVYRVATCKIINGAAVITGWDRSVFRLNLTSMEVKNQGKLGAVALSAAQTGQDMLLGLASGEIASVKFKDEENLAPSERIDPKTAQIGAVNSLNKKPLNAAKGKASQDGFKANAADKTDVNLSQNAVLPQVCSDKLGANLTDKTAKNEADVNLSRKKTSVNSLDTKPSANTNTREIAPKSLNAKIYEISNLRIKSLLSVRDKIYIGLDNGEIWRANANFTDIERLGKNSDAIISIFNNNEDIITVSINGEIKIYK
ncbi:MAG: hypothetical protein ACFNTA_03425 [Campylobacter sp.]|uniref:hypothetical protein n=1 Tax=Campylobacter sp. TaxID=205 RepID=UPI00361A6880